MKDEKKVKKSLHSLCTHLHCTKRSAVQVSCPLCLMFSLESSMAMKIFKAAQEHGLRTRPLENTDEIIKRLGATMNGIS
jgi:hypothetical protein